MAHHMPGSSSRNAVSGAPFGRDWTAVLIVAAVVLCVRCACAAAEAPLTVLLFASSTCESCREVKTQLLPSIQGKWGARIRVTHIPVDDAESFKLQLLYETRYGVNDDEALKVFVGGQCLSGKKAIWERLEGAVAAELAKGSVTPTPDEVRKPAAGIGASAGSGCATPVPTAGGGYATSSAAVLERFGRFKPGAIALAGLVDGINPCAFTTLVFFISLLTALGKGRREILVVGICFAAAVFLTYLVLGFGALKAVKVASVDLGIARGITWAVAGVTLAFAGYSFYDFYKYRRSGKGEDLSLKLPDRIRNRVRTVISRQMRTRNLVIGALLLGVVVSLLEAMCTGQVYLPTLMCLAQDRDLAPKAVGYLLLYNAMFIFPLLGVFALAFCGVTSERLAEASRKHVGTVKLLLGVVFLGLAAMLLITVV